VEDFVPVGQFDEALRWLALPTKGSTGACWQHPRSVATGASLYVRKVADDVAGAVSVRTTAAGSGAALPACRTFELKHDRSAV